MGRGNWLRFAMIGFVVFLAGDGCRPYTRNGEVFPWRGRWRLIALYEEDNYDPNLLKEREAVWGGHIEMYITDDARLFMEIPESGKILIKGVKVEKFKDKRDVKFIVIPSIRLDSLKIPGITDGYYSYEDRYYNYVAYFQTDWNKGRFKGGGRVSWKWGGDPRIGGMVLEFELIGKE